jgi:hypothetical protein
MRNKPEDQQHTQRKKDAHPYIRQLYRSYNRL